MTQYLTPRHQLQGLEKPLTCFPIAVANTLISMKEYKAARRFARKYPCHRLVEKDGGIKPWFATKVLSDIFLNDYFSRLNLAVSEENLLSRFSPDSEKLRIIKEEIRRSRIEFCLRDPNICYINPCVVFIDNFRDYHAVSKIDNNTFIDNGVIRDPSVYSGRYIGILELFPSSYLSTANSIRYARAKN